MAETTVAVRHSTPDSEKGPGAHSAAWLEQHPAVELCDDVYGGTKTMREAGRRYLRQHPKEEDDAYTDRLNDAVLFNAFRRTVKGLTGMVFRKAPIISEDMDEAIEELLENIDLSGRDVFRFAKDQFLLKTRHGHSHIFVDWHGPDGVGSEEEEDAAGARPYWTLIEKSQAIRFWAENKDGKTVLVSFAWLQTETTRVDDDGFEEQTIERVRQYDLVGDDQTVRVSVDGSDVERVIQPIDADGTRVRYRSWTRVADSQGEWDPEERGRFLGKRMTEIPLVTDYAERTGFMTSNPPLLDLAYENAEHWRVRSERSQSLGVASIPVFTIIGDLKKDEVQTVSIGPAIGLILPKGATAAYVETAGNALEASRDEIRDIEQRMATMGLSLLVRRPTQPQTAEAEKLNRSEQDSELADSAEGTEAALADALRLTAMWMGIPADKAGSIGLNKDFNLLSLTPQMIAVLLDAVDRRLLTNETLWDMLEYGEVLPPTFDAERERETLDAAGEEELRLAIEMQRQQQAAGGDGGEDDDAEGDEE